MQKNDQEKSVVQKPWILDVLEKFFGFLGNLFSRSNLWSFFLFILFFLFFISDGFRTKYSDWFFDSISKVTGKSSIPSGVQIRGDVDATVSIPFKDAIQACGYYHANYKNSHSYTVLWNKSKVEGGYPKIRVIAEPAYWQAEKCTQEEGEVKLIGIEYTKHSIEAQLEKNKGFVQIATSDAYYRSALFFDGNGRITERKVLKSDFEYEYESVYSNLCYVLNEAMEKEDRCDKITSQGIKHFKDLTKKKSDFNILKITSGFNPDKGSKESEAYSEAIILYIKEREKLHKELVEKGCGAISIEPDLEQDSGDFLQTSIAFLCLKKSRASHSHVRLMHRVSEQNF